VIEFGFAAIRERNGVRLRWRAAAETDTLGFNVFRDRSAVRDRLNSDSQLLYSKFATKVTKRLPTTYEKLYAEWSGIHGRRRRPARRCAAARASWECRRVSTRGPRRIRC